MQELFEVNRHAAYLTQVRQNLLDDMQRAVANEQKKDADVEQLHSLIRAMYSKHVLETDSACSCHSRAAGSTVDSGAAFE